MVKGPSRAPAHPVSTSMRFRKFYDATAPITPTTPVFPGDPRFAFEELTAVTKGDQYRLCHLHLGNHMGTHVDFPAHVIADGNSSRHFPIEHFVGHGRVLDLPGSERVITEAAIRRAGGGEIQEDEIVFFKTANSQRRLMDTGTFATNYVYADFGAAHYLLKRKVRMVGVDYISIDGVDDEALPVHHLLLGNNVLIVEGLALCHVPAGLYCIFCLPLNIPDMDGLPVRATLAVTE